MLYLFPRINCKCLAGNEADELLSLMPEEEEEELEHFPVDIDSPDEV